MGRRAAAAALVLALVLVPSLAAEVVAQDTPGGVGQPVPYVDGEGVTHGTVTVQDVADPFTGFNPDRPPEPGTRYVLLTVTFEASDEESMDANPHAIYLQGSDGSLWSPGSVPRPSEAKIPDLESQSMSPGDRIRGVVGFTIPADTKSDRVVYYLDSTRIILLADLLGQPGPSLGADVPLTDAAGASATLTVQLADPFADFDPDRAPEANTRFALATLVFSDTGGLPFAVDPSTIVVRDSDGYVWYRTDVRRVPGAVIPDLTRVTLAPGDRISGVLGFALPAAAQLVEIDWWLDGGHLVQIADLGSGGKGEDTPGPSPAP
jgi:hypothetical protein